MGQADDCRPGFAVGGVIERHLEPCVRIELRLDLPYIYKIFTQIREMTEHKNYAKYLCHASQMRLLGPIWPFPTGP